MAQLVSGKWFGEITLREVLRKNYLRESGSGESLSGRWLGRITFGNVVRENDSAGSRSAEKGHSGSQNRRGRRTLPCTLRSISASIALQESKCSMESAQRSMESAQRSMESAQRSWKASILYCGPMDAGQAWSSAGSQRSKALRKAQRSRESNSAPINWST